MDPKNPGAVDEIIYLGDFWDEEGIRAKKDYILADNREVGRQFARGYRYLKAAAAIYDDTRAINSWALDKTKVNEIAAELIDSIFGRMALSECEGCQRNLFASAITPEGLKNHLESLLVTGKVYVLKGPQGTNTEKVLEKVKDAALEKGFCVEAYYCTMNPNKIEHLIIPEIGVSLTTENKYHSANVKPYAVFDFNEFLDKNILNLYTPVLEYNEREFEKLLNKAIETISKAKMMHDRIEQYYIPNMDFEAVQRCWECTMARILEHTEK